MRETGACRHMWCILTLNVRKFVKQFPKCLFVYVCVHLYAEETLRAVHTRFNSMQRNIIDGMHFMGCATNNMLWNVWARGDAKTVRVYITLRTKKKKTTTMPQCIDVSIVTINRRSHRFFYFSRFDIAQSQWNSKCYFFPTKYQAFAFVSSICKVK